MGLGLSAADGHGMERAGWSLWEEAGGVRVESVARAVRALTSVPPHCCCTQGLGFAAHKRHRAVSGSVQGVEQNKAPNQGFRLFRIDLPYTKTTSLPSPGQATRLATPQA